MPIQLICVCAYLLVCTLSSRWVPPANQLWKPVFLGDVYSNGATISYFCDGSVTPATAPTTYILTCGGALGWYGVSELLKTFCGPQRYVVALNSTKVYGFFQAASECVRLTNMTLPWVRDEVDIAGITAVIAKVNNTLVPLGNNIRRSVCISNCNNFIL